MSKKEATKPELLSPAAQAKIFMHASKDEVYNFEKDSYYKVRSSSLILNDGIGGGITPGAHRFIGINSGGKTSCSLDFMLWFLKTSGRRGVFFKCEGRLSPEVQARSGIKFVTNPEEWADDTCLIFESNVFEVVFGFIRELIVNNPLDTKYFFIIDSVDGMILRDDMAKPLTDAGRVAGGALVTSVFLKKAGAALCKRGHICIFISQIRDSVSTNQYAPPPPRQGKSSGGHALEHNANVVIDFLNRTEQQLIRDGGEDVKDKEDAKESRESSSDNRKAKIIGHWCKVKLIKTDNEANGTLLEYPIKYGRTGGKSVWVEYEILNKLLEWEMLKKSGTWFSFEPAILEEIRKIDADFPETIQGKKAVRVLLEDRHKVVEYLTGKFSILHEV